MGMVKSLRSMFRRDKVVRINRNSWLGRNYFNWQRQSGFDKGPGFRENFCHFLRVATIWSAQGWFFHKKLKNGFRPWMIFVLAAIALGMVAMIVIWPLEVLKVVGITVGYFFILFFGLRFIFWVTSISRHSWRWNLIKFVSAPLWLPIYVLGMSGIWLYEHVIYPMYLTPYRRLWLTYVVTLLFIAVVLFNFEILDEVLKVIFVTGLVILAALGISFLIIEGAPEYRRWRANRAHQAYWRSFNEKPASVKKGTNLVGIARAVIATKQGSRICPFIEFVGDDPLAAVASREEAFSEEGIEEYQDYDD